MELTFRKSPPVFTSVKLSIYHRLTCYLLITMAASILGVMLILRVTTHPTNPFSDFLDVFPGQAQPLASRGFDCQRTTDHYTSDNTVCSSQFNEGAFSQITLLVVQNRIYQSTFIVRENELRFGDLMQNLDMTNFRAYPHEIFFFWQKLFVTVKTSLVRHATALRPVAIIMFTDVDLPNKSVTFSAESQPN